MAKLLDQLKQTRSGALAVLCVGLGVAACSTWEYHATFEPPTRLDAIMMDSDVVDVLHTANSGEIEAGRLASGRAYDPRVRDYAARMVRDHTVADREMIRAYLDAAENLPTIRDDHPISRDLLHSGRESLEALKALDGPSFDQAYIDNQVEMHSWTLEMIERAMLPVTDKDDLEGYLEDLREHVAEHLRQAMELQSSLASR
jgi:putative membrane protein